MEAIKAKKTKKVIRTILIVLLSIIVLFFAVIGGILGVKAIEINRLTKLQSQPAPTAEYLDLMPDTDEIYGWIEDLVNMGVRQPGTAAHAQATQFVYDKFDSFGLDNVHIENSDTIVWRASEWGLSVNGTAVDSYFMAHTFNSGNLGAFSTPAGGLNAELVYVGSGTAAKYRKTDVQGKIVVADIEFSSVPVGLAKLAGNLFYDPNKTLGLFDSRLDPYSANDYPYNYYRAMENGAVGFIGILTNYIDSNQYNNEDYSYLGGNMELPGLWVSKTAGEQLKTYISSGTANASMTLVGQRKQEQGSAIIGYVQGQSDEVILVHSHHDSSTPGAVEDASGTAVVIALAKFFSQIPLEHRGKTIMFLSIDTHFTDYDTHDVFIENHLQGQDNILVDICIEHIAKEAVEGADGKLEFTGLVEPRLIFFSGGKDLLKITKEEVVRHRYGRTTILPATLLGDEVPSDADMFFQEGIPIISLVSGPIYLYDNLDTLDTVAKEELRPTTEVFAAIIWRLFGVDASSFK